MKVNKVLLGLFNNSWLIDPGYANAQLPFVINWIKSPNLAFDDDKAENNSNEDKICIVSADLSERVYLSKDIKAAGIGKSKISAGSIAVVPINGALMKDDYCGSIGYMTRAEQTNALANNPNIAAIIYEFDTPGGSVSGLQTFADAINYAKKQKPVLGFVNDGYCASAGYWLASQCDELYVSHKSSSVGSVGVMIRLTDFSGAYEADGIKIHEIYADGSEEKNADYREALKGNYDLIKAELNMLRDLFVSSVKTGRSTKLSAKGTWEKGAMFDANDAKKQGLIDGIKNFDGVIKRAGQLMQASSSSTQPELSNQSNNMKLKTATHAALIALCGITVAEGATETAELTEAQIDALNTAVAGIQAKVTQHETTIANLTEEKSTLTASLDKEKAEVTRLKVFEPKTTAAIQQQATAEEEKPWLKSAHMQAALKKIGYAKKK